MDLTETRRNHNLVTPYEPEANAALRLEEASDEALLRACGDGNNGALEELVRRYKRPLARLLSRLLTSPEDVEEALLNVFVQAWQHSKRFQFRSRVGTWLYRIAVNQAYDIQKQQKRLQAHLKQEAADYDRYQGNAEDEALRHLAREQQAASLQRALNRLNESDRLLLVLYYYEQMDYEQIQGITRLSYTVLKTRLTRARRRLRQLLEEEDREAGS
jgi:RNA polymerase sigma-70 factor (ECF subfamily)